MAVNRKVVSSTLTGTENFFLHARRHMPAAACQRAWKCTDASFSLRVALNGARQGDSEPAAVRDPAAGLTRGPSPLACGGPHLLARRRVEKKARAVSTCEEGRTARVRAAASNYHATVCLLAQAKLERSACIAAAGEAMESCGGSRFSPRRLGGCGGDGSPGARYPATQLAIAPTSLMGIA